jgi:predicted protein tyrosine phosphatase
MPNFRIAAWYGVLLAMICVAAVAGWPWGAWLIWPAASLLLAISAYCGLGPGIYRKVDGRIPWPARLLMAPLLVGQYLSLVFYRRQCRAWDEALPGLWIGRQLSNAEARLAKSAGVTAVLDLTSEFSETAEFRSLRYFNVAILDLTSPTEDQIDRAIAFIGDHRRSGTVYVHCKVGYSRTAAIVGAYLIASGHCETAETVVSLLRECRPTIVIRPEAMVSLAASELRLCNS